MYEIFNKNKRISPYREKDILSKDKEIWNKVLSEFASLPKERQDAIFLKILNNLYNDPNRQRLSEFILQAKC